MVSKATIEVKKAVEEVPNMLDEDPVSVENGIQDMEMHINISKVLIPATTLVWLLIPLCMSLFFMNFSINSSKIYGLVTIGVRISQSMGFLFLPLLSHLLLHLPSHCPCPSPSLGPPHSSYNLMPQPPPSPSS